MIPRLQHPFARTRRTVRSTAVFLVGLFFLGDGPPRLGAQDGFTRAELRPVREGVTAGAMTTAPTEYTYRTGAETEAGLVMTAEDRRTRILDRNGELVAEYRTGIRIPHAVIALPGGVLTVIGPDEAPHILGYRNGRFRGTILETSSSSHSDGKVARNGTPSPKPIAVYADPHENIFTLNVPGTIRYTSAAGRRLYERPLPAPIRSHFSDGETLFIGLADGRLFGFFRDGRGELLARFPSPIVDINVSHDRGEPYLLAIDRAGIMYRLDPATVAGTQRRELRTRWSRDVSEEIRGDRFRFASGMPAGGSVIVSAIGGGAGAFTAGGRVLWTRTVPGSGFTWIAVFATPSVVVATTADNRLFLFGDRGDVVAVRQLQRRPVAVYPLQQRKQLLLEYPEWRYELLELSGNPDSIRRDDSVTASRQSASVFPASTSGESETSGALGALGDSVLDGTSLHDRNTLLSTLRHRITRASLFGSVGTFRSILIKLAGEVYRTPWGRGGVVQNDFPAIRIAAVSLLTDLGDRPARRALSNVIRQDPNPGVVAAALHGIAAAGRDDVSAVTAGYERFRGFSDQERIAIADALVRCLESAIPGPEAQEAERFREIAVEIATTNLPRSIRERAVSVGRRW